MTTCPGGGRSSSWLGAGWVQVDRSAVQAAGGELLLLGDSGVRGVLGKADFWVVLNVVVFQ